MTEQHNQCELAHNPDQLTPENRQRMVAEMRAIMDMAEAWASYNVLVLGMCPGAAPDPVISTLLRAAVQLAQDTEGYDLKNVTEMLHDQWRVEQQKPNEPGLN